MANPTRFEPLFDKAGCQAIGDAVGAGTLNGAQISGIYYIAKFADDYRVTDARQLAYMLATAWHEAAWRGVSERRAKRGTEVRKMQDKYWHTGYYGRGLVQLTWKKNYALFGKRLGIDLVGNPDLALKPRTGAQILVDGMTGGLFTGAKLSRFFPLVGPPDWINARKVVNGTFHAEPIAAAALKILDALETIIQKKTANAVQQRSIMADEIKTNPFDLSELVESLGPVDRAQAREYRRLFEAGFEKIAEQLGARRDVRLHPFGSFRVEERKARTYTAFGKPVAKPVRLAVEFTPHKTVKDAMQAATGMEVVS